MPKPESPHSLLVARRIAIVAFPGAQALDVIGPFDVFAGATEAQTRSRARDHGYQPVLAAPETAALRCENGLSLIPEITLSRLLRSPEPVDTLIVAGGRGAREAARQPQVTNAVRRLAWRARRVASVCTGAFVLAGAGLLRGRRATTHWAYCEQLAEQYPEVEVERDPIFVRDGRLWTSAGVTAGIDLALAMVEDDLGSELALLVARHLVVFVRRAGGQSQFSTLLETRLASSGLCDLTAWIVEHPEADLSVPALARRAKLSVRHFSRMFQQETGQSPAVYVEKVRLETARRLLETTAGSVEQTATQSGFGTPEAMRRAFSRRVGLSPREYRARFGRQLERRTADGSAL